VSASLSSFLTWYMVIEPGMPHAMSFAASTFFQGYWIRTRPVTRARDWVILGALIGVAALVRWQNGVFISRSPGFGAPERGGPIVTIWELGNDDP